MAAEWARCKGWKQHYTRGALAIACVCTVEGSKRLSCSLQELQYKHMGMVSAERHTMAELDGACHVLATLWGCAVLRCVCQCSGCKGCFGCHSNPYLQHGADLCNTPACSLYLRTNMAASGQTQPFERANLEAVPRGCGRMQHACLAWSYSCRCVVERTVIQYMNAASQT